MKKKSKIATEPEYELPTEMEDPCGNLFDFTFLFYGKKKIGKTQLAAQFPEPLLLGFEPGMRGVRAYKRFVPDWRALRAYTSLLKKTRRFKTVVWDTTDMAHMKCEAFICQKLGIDHPGDEAYSKGWNAVRDEFLLQIDAIAQTGRTLIWISHEKQGGFKTRKHGELSKIEPSMSGAAGRILEALTDMTIHFEVDDENRRWMRIRGNEEVVAGHRIDEHFKGINRIPMGENASEAYQNLLNAFAVMKAKGGSEKTKKKVVVVRR